MSICAWVFMPWMVEVMGAQGQILTDSVFWPYTACFLSFALAGAAWATVIAEITGGLLPVLYFLVNRKGVLYLSRP
ncbi:MAG: hypothetical protein SPD15_06090 [Allisonella histaminiformans]|uniref:hypothetical protein n=2 Tax=Allisonella histaminiformans TaxID=209880 RepID=UPI0023543FDE|nr:hypothetical protein [Allisonella histaminiformans]MCI6003204.1 hypothetical protein [Allisonella histaminiformans]MDY4541027.1 hypothetical protein [Allisonella histaminiformans]